MVKKIIVIILILIEIWSVTGVVVTLNNKNDIKDSQNIKEELNTEKDDQVDSDKVDENDNTSNKEDSFEQKDETNADNNNNSILENDNTNNTGESNGANNDDNSSNVNKPQVDVPKEEIKEEKPDNSVPEPVTIVSSETKTENVVSTKYGVKITATKTYTVNTYSNGKIEKIEINSSNETYDKSGFNATTMDLKNEAINLANKNKNVYNEILGYVNGYRSAVGRNSIVLDDNLSVAATIRAMELAYTSDVMNISHTRPNGTKFWTIMSDMGIGYSNVGENIAADSGYGTPKTVTNSWKNSQGHYENMISTNYGKMGVGFVELGGNKYWVQIFTN